MKAPTTSGVFVLKDKDTLVPMAPARFASEDDFQSLLAKFPALLSGDQIDPVVPRKWLLVKREKAVPDDEDSAGRWSLDHLFLDQDGIPTLLEVKRQSDSRLRREVVGQMLDYAANCVAYWSVEGLQADLGATCSATGRSSAQVLSETLGIESNEEDFWRRVKTNLEAGRIRLLFVADTIPQELRRIIEFLNKQMDPAEVLGLELRQFEGQGSRTIVPLVVGQTQEAIQKKSGMKLPERIWDEKSIFAELEARCSGKEIEVARRTFDWMKSSGGALTFGIGRQDGSILSVFTDDGGLKFRPIILYTYGRIEVLFQFMKGLPYFDDIAHREEFVNKLNAIHGVSISRDQITKRSSISLKTLSSSRSQVDKLVEALDWAVRQFKSDKPNG
jgi:hypothetical protein